MSAYLLAHIDVTDPDLFAEYGAKVAPLLAQFGGRYLVRGGAPVPIEGAPFKRIVIIEFPTEDQAQAFWNAPEYAPLRALRQRASTIDAAILPAYD